MKVPSYLSGYIEDDGQMSFRHVFDEEMKYDALPENVRKLHRNVLADLRNIRDTLIMTYNQSNPEEVEAIFPHGKHIGKLYAGDDGIYYKGIVLDEMIEPFFDNGVIIERGSVFEKTGKTIRKTRHPRYRSLL
ncbi:MAG: hypothetical protein JW789_02875 [Candidatus Aenigmarchaeota archaeon]|nr:hypothetical protein [Candidatus Aenigmarchaeota archaeon]